MRLAALFVVAFVMVCGCGSPAPESDGPMARPGTGRLEFRRPGDDPWKLTWTDPSVAAPALLWNGLIGVRIGPTGAGYDAAGKPLPFFAIDEYETSGQENIRQLPNPLGVRFEVGGEQLGPMNRSDRADLSDWSQTLDLKTGLVTTEWKQDIGAAGLVSVKSESVIDPTARVLSQRWTLEAEKGAPVKIHAGFAGQETGSWTADVVTFGPSETKARIAQQPIGFRVEDSQPDPTITPVGVGVVFSDLSLEAGKPAVFERTVAIGRSRNLVDMAKARGIALKLGENYFDPPTAPDFQLVADSAAEQWAERWKTDIEIDGPVEDQQAVRSFLFYLQSAIHPDGDMAISPMGLSRQDYNGHVFWDADLWVFPALAFVAPELAREIPDYRLAMVATARENYLDWIKDGRPIARGKIDAAANPVLPGFESLGLKFPWESSVSGKETAPEGEWRYQHHVTGTVAFVLLRAAELGLVEPWYGADEPAIEASVFYRNRIEKRSDGKFDLLATMSPDEHHIADNDLYTNILAQGLLERYFFYKMNRLTRPGEIPTLHLPKDEKSFLTYENDHLKGYKQAAAVLAIYPLQYPPAEAQAKVMMERFAGKVSRNGPAMSDSVHAVIWARLGETEKAYEAWHQSWQEFVRPPHLLFSETRVKDESYFTTGAGGSLQSVIYGFLGFRIDSQPEPGAAWSKQLKGERWLSIKPNLPKAWNKVTFRNFKVLGESYTLTATSSGAHVEKGDR